MRKDRASKFSRMIRPSPRGRLKVYLGYGAGVGKTYQMLQEGHRLMDVGVDVAVGVGKTYQMLQEGHRLMDVGVDVVVGLVETHGRIETAKLLEGLEVISRRQQEYRGYVLEELDVEALIARRPEVVLIDELAHTNAPGSRNPKRYQDVQDILAAGIHVNTTLNVQHLESLYDIVEKTVHVKVRKRLPDTVLAEAAEIVTVDLTTEDPQQRLQEGKSYSPDRIEAAVSNFFKISSVERLREPTLRGLQSQSDLKMPESSEENGNEATPEPDQVMVCLSSRGPNPEMLLRYASRLAARLNRNWYAVYVQTPSEEPTIIDASTQRVLSSTLTLAKQLGAMVFTYKGEDVADTILRFAREYRVGHIVLGYPGEVPISKGLVGKKSIVDQLIKKSRGITTVLTDNVTIISDLDTRAEELPDPQTPAEFPEINKPVPLEPRESSVDVANHYVG